MNEHQSFEREVADWIASERISTTSDRATDKVLSSASRIRQDSRWLASIKEPSMRHSDTLAVGSPTARVAAIMLATLLVAALVVGAGIAGGRLLASDTAIIVDPDGGGTVTTIGAAVAMAEDGDTILVRPGTYDESVDITEDITIRGDGDRDDIVIELSVEMPARARHDSPNLPHAFELVASDATIEGLTLRGESARIVVRGGSPTFRNMHLDDIGRLYLVDPGSISVPSGFDIRDGSTATVAKSLFSGSALFIQLASSPRVLDNEFREGGIGIDGTGTDPLVQGNTIENVGSFHAVTAWGGARPEIRGNTFRNNESAINVRYRGFPSPDTDPYPTNVDNAIEGSRTGISLDGGAAAEVRDNRLQGNDVGIAINGPTLARETEAVLEGNIVSAGSAGRAGIAVTGTVAPQIKSNEISGHQNGVVIAFGSSPILRDNTICDNEVNLNVHDDATVDDDGSNEICEDSAASPDG